MSEGLDLRTCENCKDVFVYSHIGYRPKLKMIPVENSSPTILVYCSDACLDGVPKQTAGPCSHDMRNYLLTEGRYGKKWLCKICWVLIPVEEKIKQ